MVLFSLALTGIKGQTSPMRGAIIAVALLGLVGCGGSSRSVESTRATGTATRLPRPSERAYRIAFHRPSRPGAQRRFEGSLSDDTEWTSPNPAFQPQTSHRRYVLRGREQIQEVDSRGFPSSSYLIVDRCLSYDGALERTIAAPGSRLIIRRQRGEGSVEIEGQVLSPVDRFWLAKLVDASLSSSELQSPETQRRLGDRWRVSPRLLLGWFWRSGTLEQPPTHLEITREFPRVRAVDGDLVMEIETTIDASGLIFSRAPARLSLTASSMHASIRELLPTDPRLPLKERVMEVRMRGSGTATLPSGRPAAVEFLSRRVVSRSYRYYAQR